MKMRKTRHATELHRSQTRICARQLGRSSRSTRRVTSDTSHDDLAARYLLVQTTSLSSRLLCTRSHPPAILMTHPTHPFRSWSTYERESERLTGILKAPYQNPPPLLQRVPNSHRRWLPAADLLRVQDRETRPDHFLKGQA